MALAGRLFNSHEIAESLPDDVKADAAAGLGTVKRAEVAREPSAGVQNGVNWL
jgi:hypothetical protein